jgi:hypothetical protein
LNEHALTGMQLAVREESRPGCEAGQRYPSGLHEAETLGFAGKLRSCRRTILCVAARPREVGLAIHGITYLKPDYRAAYCFYHARRIPA